jgi:hypothetical protein
MDAIRPPESQIGRATTRLARLRCIGMAARRLAMLRLVVRVNVTACTCVVMAVIVMVIVIVITMMVAPGVLMLWIMGLTVIAVLSRSGSRPSERAAVTKPRLLIQISRRPIRRINP